MRIALLSYEYPPDTGFGGIGTYTYYHAHALRRLGHDVHVIAGSVEPRRETCEDRGVLVTRFRKAGPTERLLRSAEEHELWWFRNRMQTATNMFAALRRVAAGTRFDVVEMPECGADGALVSHLMNLPTIVRLHSPAELIMPTYDTRRLDRALTAAVERLGITGARAISSCSHWLAREARSRMAIDRPIEVIPNGIDLRLFDQDTGIDVHERFGIPRGALTVFFANRLESRKGIEVVRDLLVPTLQRHDDVVFVLAGADPDDVVGQTLRPTLHDHGLDGRLITLGRIDQQEVRACLKQCDVFLLPSIWENAPYSLLEAMSASRAVVASDCGGVPEILRHEVDGLIARTGDVESFRRALDRLVRQPALRARLGRSARQRIEARFSDEVVARRAIAFYEWAVGAPSSDATKATQRAESSGRGLAIGPDNWFQVWWLRGGAAGETPYLARGADGTATFARCTLDELAFAHRVLVRTYWSGPGQADTPEARFVDQLGQLHRERALAAWRGAEDAGPGVSLGLPASNHPMFAADDAASVFLDELWRLGDTRVVRDWLEREANAPEFVEASKRSIALRRLAIHAARWFPSPANHDVLRRIYRNVADAPRIVAEDRAFIESHPRGPELERAVEDLGLHAPTRRPAVFARRRGSAPTARPASAEVTVLIPSYNHAAYVEGAIRSALDQDLPPARVLVVDDRSPDDTADAARAIDDERVVVRVNAQNLGLGRSIAGALDDIDTPYVALLNSDDLFHPNRLGYCIDALSAAPGHSLVATDLVTMDDRSRRLLASDACAVECGPEVFGWLRWFDSIRGSLSRPEEATSFAALLQHNHLVTSSNIVCRVDFLREHRDAFEGLRYCLDWMLFLRAAASEQLLFVPEELLGYRLHGTNTVWFDERRRADYVHEVNHVTAAALRNLVARKLAAGVDGRTLVQELAALLRGSVSRHGETDGFELFLADLVGARAEDATAADDGTCIPSALLAGEALARKERDRALAALDVSPWRLRELHEKWENLSAARHVADALFDAESALTRRLAWTESRLAESESRGDDTDAMRVEFDRQRGGWGEKERALTAERDALAAQFEDARRQLADLGSRIVERDAEVERLGQALARLESDHSVLREESERDRRRLETELGWTRRALRRLFADGQDAVRRVLDAPAWRLGRTLAGGASERVAKTLLRVVVHGHAHWTRAMSRTARLLVRSTSRVVVAGPGPGVIGEGWRSLDLATECADAGLDVLLLGYDRPTPAIARPPEDGSRPRRRRLGADAALFAADERWFERRMAESIRELRSVLGAEQSLGPACTFARAARAAGAERLLAPGLGSAAVQAWIAARLLEVPFSLSVDGRDVRRAPCDEQITRLLLIEAGSVDVDRDATADALRSRFGDLRARIAARPPVPPPAEVVPAAGDSLRVAWVFPALTTERALDVVEALRRAVEAGADLTLEVLGRPDAGAHELEAVEWLASAARLSATLRDRVVVRRHPDPEHALRSLREADVLLDAAPGTSPATILARALAAGLAVVTTAGAPEVGPEAAAAVCNVPDRDPGALAEALADLARDASRRGSIRARASELAADLRRLGSDRLRERLGPDAASPTG